MTEALDPITARALKYIEACNDPAKLRRLAANAKTQGNEQVREAARLKLYAVSPAEAPGTLEYDVWISIFALEDMLTAEAEATRRLGRTRPKISRDGEAATVADLVLKKEASEGFHMLIDRGRPELTFEAVALRHPDRFSPEVLTRARERLAQVGWPD